VEEEHGVKRLGKVKMPLLGDETARGGKVMLVLRSRSSRESSQTKSFGASLQISLTRAEICTADIADGLLPSVKFSRSE
jgi:hypothetical protein